MMDPKHRTQSKPLRILSGVCTLSIILCTASSAQTHTITATDKIDPAFEAVPSVTLNVENGNMVQILNAFSLQTGKSIVIGPEVVSTNVNMHLNDVQWDNALEIILKPYGYGYTVTGNALVINRLDEIASVQAVEPLKSEVFVLNYLDASDIKETIGMHLSPRGSMSVLLRKGLVGWKNNTANQNSSNSGSTLGKRERKEASTEELQKSKTFIITDIPSVLARVKTMIEQIDIQPKQVLIEATFMEVNVNYLRDIGVDFTLKKDNETVADANTKTLFSSITPNGFNAAAADLAGNPLNVGGIFSVTTFGDPDVNILLQLLQEDDDSNLLSAPKVLTLNNQEATIIVGTKYPIIRSETSGDTATTSTSLDSYENIGIQLNVVPQVCAANQINMIVHPSVSEKEGETSGVTVTSGITALTAYPIVSIREVETQIILTSGETAVIGGLMTQRDGKSTFKVPLLGDIPILGRLFRRNVNSTENIELLVFLKATVINPDAYPANSIVEYDQLDAKRLFPSNKIDEISKAVMESGTIEPSTATEMPPLSLPEEPAAAETLERHPSVQLNDSSATDELFRASLTEKGSSLMTGLANSELNH